MLISARDDMGRQWQPRLPAEEVQLTNYEGELQSIQVRLTEAGGFILHQPGRILRFKILDGHTIEILPAEVEND